MKITSKDQLKKNSIYYYVLYSNPKLEHQGDGVSIYSCIYQNCNKEKEEKYGFTSGNRYVLKTNEQIVFAGRNNNNYYTIDTYMDAD